MLGLLGFYDELGQNERHPNGCLIDAVRPSGEPDEEDIVAYLDTGHFLLDVMEGCPDVLTGETHRHTAGGSSLMSDGSWLWRQDFPHYLETYHVDLPPTFLAHVRALGYRMPSMRVSEFWPQLEATLPAVGWTAPQGRPPEGLIHPEPREVLTKRQFDEMRTPRKRKQRRGLVG